MDHHNNCSQMLFLVQYTTNRDITAPEPDAAASIREETDDNTQYYSPHQD